MSDFLEFIIVSDDSTSNVSGDSNDCVADLDLEDAAFFLGLFFRPPVVVAVAGAAAAATAVVVVAGWLFFFRAAAPTFGKDPDEEEEEASSCLEGFFLELTGMVVLALVLIAVCIGGVVRSHVMVQEGLLNLKRLGALDTPNLFLNVSTSSC